MRRSAWMVFSLLALESFGQSREVRLPKLDTVVADGTQYLFLGLEFDSAFVLITGAGRTWLYAFPRIDSARPAGTFGFKTHEGYVCKVLHTDPQEVRLLPSDTATTPYELPPAYFISKLSLAPLDLRLRQDRYRFLERGMGVSAGGGKSVDLVRSFNGTAEDTIRHSLGSPVKFHEVTLTLHALYHGGVGGHHVYILGYSPIHAAGIRPPQRPRQAESHNLWKPLFPHPDRPGAFVTPDGRINKTKLTGHISAPSDP